MGPPPSDCAFVLGVCRSDSESEPSLRSGVSYRWYRASSYWLAATVGETEVNANKYIGEEEQGLDSSEVGSLYRTESAS